jgi:ATP-dependent RNA helicase SUPV3L1/SUV3
MGALGYRMEMRQKPPEPEPVEPPGDQAEPGAHSANGPETALEAPPGETEAAPSEPLLAEPDHAATRQDDPGTNAFAATPEAAAGESDGAEAPPPDLVGSPVPGQSEAPDTSAMVPERPLEGAPPEEAPADAAQPTEQVAASLEERAPDAAQAPPLADGTAPPAKAAGEPELIEVWCPGGRGSERRSQRRPRPRQERDRERQRAPDSELPIAASAASPEGVAVADRGAPAAAAEPSAETAKPPERHRRHRPPPPGEFRGRIEGERGERGERPAQRAERGERQGRRGERPERGHERPYFAKDHAETRERPDYAPRRERDKQPDPDSPFAKLAALKAQLEAKERG